MPKTKELSTLKQEINEKHIKFYDNTLSILEFILEEYSKELTRADIDFLEMSKNSVSILDFLISSITKIQKGHRLALGLDNSEDIVNQEPVINIIEGLNEDKV